MLDGLVNLTKEELLARLNTDVITDILCTTQQDGDMLDFCVEMRMQSGRTYCFTQPVIVRADLRPLEVLCFTDGDCSHVLELEAGFRPADYPYDLPNQEELYGKMPEADAPEAEAGDD